MAKQTTMKKLVAAIAATIAISGNVTTPAAAAPPQTTLTGCNPAPLPGLCVGRAATAQEEASMIGVGKAGIESELGLADGEACVLGQKCFVVGNPSRAEIGTNAGSFYGTRIEGTFPTAGCYVFMHQDSAGWHYDNGRCISAVEQIPSAIDQVYTSGGCVNVRDAPSLSGRVLYCLQGGTKVYVDSAPTYAGGHIWWHLVCLGWMAHDFLVSPPGGTSHAPGSAADVPCPSAQGPYTPMISLSLDSGPSGSDVAMVASGFPPGTLLGAYWGTSATMLGTPGPNADQQGDVETDTQDMGRSIGIQFELRGGDFCLDANYSNQNPNGPKACAHFTVASVQPTTSPPAAPVSTPTPTLRPASSTTSFWAAIDVGLVVVALLLIVLSAVLWIRRRISSR